MSDRPPVIPYTTPPQSASKRRDPMSVWFAADAFLFTAWLFTYWAVTPWQMIDAPASRTGKMLTWLLLLAASGLFAVVTTCWLIRKLRRHDRVG